MQIAGTEKKGVTHIKMSKVLCQFTLSQITENISVAEYWTHT